VRTLVRDLRRQRLRSLLTITGIGLGILTLVVLGALGEHFRDSVAAAQAYVGGVVRLYTKTNARGVNPGVTPETRTRLAALPEVEAVCPTLQLYFDGFDLESDPLGFLTPKPTVLGLPVEHAEALRPSVELVAGRWIGPGDDRAAMVVDWLAERRGLEVGGEVVIRRQPYEVVGIYSAPEAPLIACGIVPYARLNADFTSPQVERAQAFFRGLAAENPGVARAMPFAADERFTDAMARRFVAQQQGLFRVYEVLPADRDPAAVRALAERMRTEVPDLAVVDPERLAADMEKVVAVFLVITTIVTVLSTVVGGLLIVNTMAMAVIERRGEIAVKAALGATPGQLARELVAEAATLGLLGAVLGLGLGVAAIVASEPYLVERAQSGSRLFLVTPRLVLLTTAYGVGMGVVAGGLPAYRAARVDPAVTLREL